MKSNPLSYLSLFSISASSAIALGNAVLTFLVSFVLARLVGVGGFGVYSLVYVILMLVSIVLHAGLTRLVTRETARAGVREDWDAMWRIWIWSLRVILAFSLGAAAVAVLAILTFDARLEPAFADTLLVGLVMLPLLVLGALGSAILQGLGFVIQGQLPGRILQPAGLVVFAGIALVVGQQASAGQAMALATLSALIAGLIAAYWLWLRLPKGARGRTFKGHGEPAWWRSMLLLTASVGLLQLNSYIDILVIGMFQPIGDVGIYRVIAQSATISLLGLQAIRQIATPGFVQFHANDNTAGLQSSARRSAQIAFGFATLVAVLGFAFGEFFLGFVFGEGFRPGVTALYILLFTNMLNAYFGPIGALLNMTGHEHLMFRSTAAAAAVNAVLCLAMVPGIGMVGGAISTLISVALWNGLAWFAAHRSLGVDSRAF